MRLGGEVDLSLKETKFVKALGGNEWLNRDVFFKPEQERDNIEV